MLERLYGITSRYILFSLHQGAESACARLALKPHSSAEALSLIKQNDTASGFLFSGLSGSLVAENRLSDTLQAPSEVFWKTLQGRSSGGKLSNFTAQEVLAEGHYFVSGCRVDAAEGPLWLLFVADAQDALKPALALFAQIGVLFVGLLLVGLMVFYFLARSLTRPLEELSQIADNLGAGNYSSATQVSGTDELGVLSDSFAILSQKLHSRESELEKSTELANQDFLTGLWNRRYLERRLQEYFSLAKRHNHDLSLIYLDADNFKRVNDTQGHAAGDEVLKDFAKILKSNVRDTDFVARVGGEEFVVVLPDTNLEGALQAAEKLRRHIKNHEFVEGLGLKLTSSFGVMSFQEDKSLPDAHELMAAADKWAYQSKTTGRDRISSPRGQIV